MRENNKLSIKLAISPGTPVSSSVSSIPARLLSSAPSPRACGCLSHVIKNKWLQGGRTVSNHSFMHNNEGKQFKHS